VTESNDFLYEKRGSVALVTFDRPEALNAFRTSMKHELSAILADAAADDAIRVLVLTGKGRAFCAGQDLKEVDESAGQEAFVAQAEGIVSMLQDLAREIIEHPKVTIAAVNGYAIGMGLELAIACDLRIASVKAQCAFTEVERGQFVGNGASYLLPRLVGLGRAMELMLSGESIDAREAHRIGLFNRVAPAESFLDEALALADRIAGHAPLSLRWVRSALRHTYERDLAAMMKLEAEGMRVCALSQDAKEGAAAFRARRAPDFTGE